MDLEGCAGARPCPPKELKLESVVNEEQGSVSNRRERLAVWCFRRILVNKERSIWKKWVQIDGDQLGHCCNRSIKAIMVVAGKVGLERCSEGTVLTHPVDLGF